jgi:hypothetical protein
MAGRRVVVFVHGWSVRNTDTYGKLPERLMAEAQEAGLGLDVQHVYLGKYISFRDEVRVEDVSRAFEAAIRREAALAARLAHGERMVVITHSTGGPVVRDWWKRFYLDSKAPCPMSHLIMLAPANFGSALAQLGKSTIGRLKSWVEGVEPGQGVLDWLELGSPDAWALNHAWIAGGPSWKGASPVYPFVLTGQSIDRAAYDHVNSYTDENGSDGVVRVAGANLNGTSVRLAQRTGEGWPHGDLHGTELEKDKVWTAPRTALAVLPGCSHSGKALGILRSIRMKGEHPAVTAVFRCLAVDSPETYDQACTDFEALTLATQAAERVEKVDGPLFFNRTFEHPLTSQVITRLVDDAGHPVNDFDFLLTSWDPDSADPVLRTPSANFLPPGFFIDRQRNRHHPNTLTYFLNHEALSRARALGVRILPRPEPEAGRKGRDYFVHYVRGALALDSRTLLDVIRPNQTLLLEIVMKRVVREGVFRLTKDMAPKDFTKDPPGPPIG